MIRKIATAAFITTASISFATFAQAEDFPAAPMNPGPMTITGMGPVGAAVNLGMTPVNMIAQPIVGAATPAAAPAAAPMMKKHHRRSMKHTMKKKM